MTEAEAYETLRQRCAWLTARIAAKRSIGWEIEWDQRERDALAFVLWGDESRRPSEPAARS